MKLPLDLKEIANRTWHKHAGRRISFFFSCLHLTGYITEYPKVIGHRFTYTSAEGEGFAWQMYRNKEDLQEMEKYLNKKLTLALAEKGLKYVYDKQQKFMALAEQLEKIDFRQASNQELVKYLKQYCQRTQEYIPGFSAFIEITTALMRKMKNELEKKIKDKNELNQTVYLIGSPSELTLQIKEEIDFYQLLIKLRKIKNEKLREKKIEKHFQKYHFMTAYIEDEGWTKKELNQRIKVSSRENPQKQLKDMFYRHQQTEKEIQKTIKKFSPSPALVKIIRKSIFMRINTENIYGCLNVASKPLFAEIAQRLHFSLNLLKNLTPREIEQALKGYSGDFLDKISHRKNHYFIITGQKQIYVFEGKKVQQVVNLIYQEPKTQDLSRPLTGVGASPGKVRAKAKIILEVKDLAKFEEGDVLVTQNTMPIFVPAMRKAMAIVTDEGGLTCHAAIVSRELGVPCIIGTKIATRVLKDGDMVEVDANKGMVKIIKRSK